MYAKRLLKPCVLAQEECECATHNTIVCPRLIDALRRFRWIVCQLDSLRRIKGSKAAIMNELRNLPKSLNEAYDRIFETIPKEDLQIVVSALDWICFNNKVFGHETMSYKVLAGAIQGDLNRQKPCAKDYRYDIEFLRELCGCLITVTAEHDCHFNDGPVLSFSHYTVMEYLATSIRFSPKCCFRLDKFTSLGERASIVSSEIFQYKISKTGTLENDQPSPTSAWQFYFGTYCNFAAIKMICECEEVILQSAELATMLTVPHHSPLETIRDLALLDDGPYILDLLLEGYGIDSAHRCTQIKFYEPSPLEVRLLFDLLRMQAFELADFMLRKVGIARNLLQTIIHLDYWFEEGRIVQNFHIPLISCIAATSSEYPANGAFQHLLKNWREAVDFRRLLLDSVALHGHEPFERTSSESDVCSEECRLDVLLRLGAETDAPDFVVTPLQIAVACLDGSAVQVLLESGAKANARGNPASMDQSEHTCTILRACDHLSGMTPLQICRYEAQKRCLEAIRGCGRYFENVVDYRLRNMKEISEEIEVMLLEYGAT